MPLPTGSCDRFYKKRIILNIIILGYCFGLGCGGAEPPRTGSFDQFYKKRIILNIIFLGYWLGGNVEGAVNWLSRHFFKLRKTIMKG